MSAEETGNVQELFRDLFHQPLIGLGFELIREDDAIYRSYVHSPTDPEDLRAVFVSLDVPNSSVMSRFGASSLYKVEVDASRDKDDPYEVIVVAESICFRRSLSVEEMLADPDRIVNEAVDVGNYAAMVEARIEGILREKEDLRVRLDRLMDSENWGIVHSGEVSPEDFLTDAERALTLYQSEVLWQSMMGTALRATVWSWASDPTRPNIADVPWQRIVDGLKPYGEARGWELTNEE